MNKYIFILIICSSLFSCKDSKEKIGAKTLFTKVSSNETHIQFENKIVNTKDLNIFNYRNFYNGGGVGIGDINNDGLSDVILTANQNKNKCNAGNIEGDNQKNELYINNKDLTFTEAAAQYNLADAGFTTHASFFDYDNDGDLDVYLLNNSFDGTFSEKIKDWSNHLSLSSMGADLADINNDGYPDVFVTDMLPEDLGRLKETSEFETYDLLQMKRSKGFHNQFMQNTLQLNNKNETFSEIAYHSGVAMTDWSWGALLLDMDNDGHKDIYVSNGIFHDLTNQDFMDFFANNIYEKMVRTGKKVRMDTIIDRMPSTANQPLFIKMKPIQNLLIRI